MPFPPLFFVLFVLLLIELQAPHADTETRTNLLLLFPQVDMPILTDVTRLASLLSAVSLSPTVYTSLTPQPLGLLTSPGMS